MKLRQTLRKEATICGQMRTEATISGQHCLDRHADLRTKVRTSQRASQSYRNVWTGSADKSICGQKYGQSCGQHSLDRHADLRTNLRASQYGQICGQVLRGQVCGQKNTQLADKAAHEFAARNHVEACRRAWENMTTYLFTSFICTTIAMHCACCHHKKEGSVPTAAAQLAQRGASSRPLMRTTIRPWPLDPGGSAHSSTSSTCHSTVACKSDISCNGQRQSLEGST